MSTTSVTTSTTSLAQQLVDLKNTTKSSIINSLNSSGDSLTQTILNAQSDSCSFSAVSQSLNAISSAARKSDVSEVMGNVQLFASSLQSDGYDTISTLKYLSMVRNLAEDDPEAFTEMFSTSDTASTIESLSE
jgi:hypothetical protein